MEIGSTAISLLQRSVEYATRVATYNNIAGITTVGRSLFQNPDEGDVVSISTEARNLYGAFQGSNIEGTDETDGTDDVSNEEVTSEDVKAEEETKKTSEASASPIDEALERLEAILKEAFKRLAKIQERLAQAMAELKGADGEAAQAAAQMKVQAIQQEATAALSVIMKTITQIVKLLKEKYKSARLMT